MSTPPLRRWRVPLLIGAAIIALFLAVAGRAWLARKQGGVEFAAADGQEARRHTNRLAGETSPYLLQHAHNPVDWYPWGPAAFEKARKEGKPIFLSIGYSACHWCHVMERESFEDEGVAQFLNQHFVSIKVDREERPDIDEIYMTAVQMLTGSGGWPMSSFLMPDGRPFFGGTYFPRDDFNGLLRKIQVVWADPEQRKQIDQMAQRVSAAIGQAAARVPEPGQVSPALFQPAVRSYLDQLDREHGGFGGAPKFPPSMRLALMLAEHAKKPDPAALEAITVTLDRMARGGMYDQVGGGFHRYSVDEKWLVPHFEKMLYDNALLAWVYLEAYRATNNPYYRRIGTETLDFVLRELRDPKGGFWSTLDADSLTPSGEKEEGWFYLWTPKEVAAVLGEKDSAVFNQVYDITRKGNFEGRSIPNLLAKPVEERAKELGLPAELLWERLDGMRAKLLTARGKRVRPPLDDKVLANWNGLMLRSLALGYDLTGEERYRQAAEAAAGFVLTTMRQDSKLRHSYRAGQSQPRAFLEDYSFLSVGLLELHRATGAERWRKEAQGLAKTMVADFWDETGGTFFSTPHHHEQLLVRLNSAEDGATPSGQSMAALVLVRLSRLTEDHTLRAKAQRVLDTYATSMKRSPAAMPNMLLAAHTYFTPEDANAAVAKAGPVAVTLADVPASVRPGETFEVTVRFAIEPGWHLNAATRSTGTRPAGPALIATHIEPAAGPFQQVAATYPAPETLRLGFTPTPLKVYSGNAAVRLKLKALPGAPVRRQVRLRVRYQACNDRVCQRPVDTMITAPLRIADQK